MKKIIISLIMIIMLIILPITVFAAGSIQPSPRNLSITKGSTKTFNITASNACGKVEVYSSNSAVATVNVSSKWIENETITVTVTGVSAGAATISVKLSDAATFDEEELTGTYKVNVKVTEPENNNGGTGNNTNNNKPNTNNNNNNTSNNTQKPANNAQNFLSGNNKLSTLSVEGHELINKDNNTYELTVTNNITNININATAEDAKATVSGAENKNLEIGLNTFEIIVKAESGAQNKYIVNVTRKDAIYLEDLTSVINNIEGDIIETIITRESKITQEILEKIKETQKTVKFNCKEGDKIIYSWIINGAELEDTKEINPNINFEAEYIEEIKNLANYAEGKYINFENIEKLPRNIKIRLYVGDEFQNEDKVNIYYYDKSTNTLEKVKSEIMVSEGYIEIEAEHSNYFITRANIQNVVEKSEINIFMIIAVIEFIIIIGLIIYCLKNKFKAVKKD